MRRRDGKRGWIARCAVASLVLHAAVLAVLLFPPPRDDVPEPLPPPSQVSMIFDGGKPTPPTVPEPSPTATPAGAEPIPPPPPPPPPPPTAVPQPAVPPPPQSEPAPNGQVPRPVAKTAPTKQPPKQPTNAFPVPQNYSFGQNTPRPLPPPPRPPGSVDLSLGPAIRGALDLSPFSQVAGREPGPDWRNALSAWVRDRAYYPEQASSQGEQGNAKVRITANPDGRVTSVELIGRSGSRWLDLALLVLFRDRTLPRLPSDVTEPISFDFTMRYILVR